MSECFRRKINCSVTTINFKCESLWKAPIVIIDRHRPLITFKYIAKLLITPNGQLLFGTYLATSRRGGWWAAEAGQEVIVLCFVTIDLLFVTRAQFPQNLISCVPLVYNETLIMPPESASIYPFIKAAV